MRAEVDHLARTIARCPIVEQCRARPDLIHPCAEIVRLQAGVPLDRHQVPEPWSGDISRAMILFVSSNPSISQSEEYPLWGWPDEWITDFFSNRFGGGRKQWILDGTRSLQKDGSYAARATAFWSKVRARAEELLGPSVIPGVDYALTEIVRCKSRAEAGVSEAMRECPKRYLRQTIEASSARLIVTLGEKARPAVVDLFGGPQRQSIHGPITVGDRPRVFASIGHPSSGTPQSFRSCFDADTVKRLQTFVRE